MIYLKKFNEHSDSEELSVHLVKDILLSVYEKEFDSHQFEFFDYIQVHKKLQHRLSLEQVPEIDFIPQHMVIYIRVFDISKDKVGIDLISRRSLNDCVFGNQFAKGGPFTDKKSEFSEIIEDWGLKFVEQGNLPKYSFNMLHPTEGNMLVVDSYAKFTCSIEK